MNLALWLTMLRLAAVPLMVLIFYLPFQEGKLTAAFIFALAALTDWFDGYVARNRKQITKFGAFLDPVADKLIVAVALVLVVGEQAVPYLAIPAAIIVSREIMVSALREWMAELGKRASVAVNKVAKFKTMLQMIALTVLLAAEPGVSVYWRMLGCLLLYVAAGMTLWSMFIYLKAAWPDLTSLINH